MLSFVPPKDFKFLKNKQQGNRVEIVVKGNGEEKRRVRKPDETMDEISTKFHTMKKDLSCSCYRWNVVGIFYL